MGERLPVGAVRIHFSSHFLLSESLQRSSSTALARSGPGGGSVASFWPSTLAKANEPGCADTNGARQPSTSCREKQAFEPSRNLPNAGSFLRSLATSARRARSNSLAERSSVQPFGRDA